ncbi:MAG: hypothetical protein ABIA77_01980 [Candidatus Omnitrophota bacterium]
MKTTAGKFTIDGDSIFGPGNYMRDKGNDLIDSILAGNDTIFNMTAHYSPSTEMAVCVRLQTDYAGYLGMKQAEGWLKREARA